MDPTTDAEMLGWDAWVARFEARGSSRTPRAVASFARGAVLPAVATHDVWSGYLVGRSRDARHALYSSFDHPLHTIPPLLAAHDADPHAEWTLFVGEPTTLPIDGYAALDAYAAFARTPVLGMVHLAPHTASHDRLRVVSREAHAASANAPLVLAALLAMRVREQAPISVVGIGEGSEVVRHALFTAKAMLFDAFGGRMPDRTDPRDDGANRTAAARATASLDLVTVLTLGAPAGDDWTPGPRRVHVVNRADPRAARHFRRHRVAGIAQPAVFFFEAPSIYTTHGTPRPRHDDDATVARALATYLDALDALYVSNGVREVQALYRSVGSREHGDAAA